MPYKPGKHCLTCDNYMGGGACRINLEPECREGGGYEAWEPRKRFVFYDEAQRYVKTVGHKGAYGIKKVLGHYELTLGEGDLRV